MLCAEIRAYDATNAKPVSDTPIKQKPSVPTSTANEAVVIVAFNVEEKAIVVAIVEARKTRSRGS